MLKQQQIFFDPTLKFQNFHLQFLFHFIFPIPEKIFLLV
jgi:hypothetical protein